jgi:mannose-6-phosphate isomerase-like protein (cupin superfamily)
MNLSNINQTKEWFEVLQTTDRSQAAVMRLNPGEATGEHAESHEDSEQLLLLLGGMLAAEIGAERLTMKDGEMVIIPAGVKHKFTTVFPQRMKRDRRSNFEFFASRPDAMRDAQSFLA